MLFGLVQEPPETLAVGSLGPTVPGVGVVLVSGVA